MTYTVREELKPTHLDGISEKQLSEHWALYKGYVAQSNTLREDLDTLRAEGKGSTALYADRRRRFAFEYAGMVMHEYYFANMKAGEDSSSAAQFKACVEARFGSFDNWQADFKATGATRGIGWAVVLYDPLTGDVNNHFIAEHAEGIITGYVPLLLMDVWEHAYLFDVGATERGKYIETFMNNINWPEVERRFKEAQAGNTSTRFGEGVAHAA